MRRGVRSFALLLALLLLVPLVAIARNRSEPMAKRRPLPVSPAESVASAAADAAPPHLLTALRPRAKGIRVALISSGVDASVLPASRQRNVSQPWGNGDRVGYGTYAASTLLELADARVVSLNVYGGAGQADPGRLSGALDWSIQHAAELDVVLVALPPHEALDPVSEAMATGTWREVLAAGAEHPVRSSKRNVFGIAFGEAGRLQREAMPADRRRAVEAFVAAAERWYVLRERITALRKKGVGVVVPAGDVGPNLQTVLGLANLPEVVTVGGFDGRGPSPQSASGPSIDGRVKPDLIAPTGLAGRLPRSSTLAAGVAALGLVDLLPVAGGVKEAAGARLDTTITSAVVAAAAMGSLGRQGIRDASRQRGALTAAAVPLPGVPVWRQGAGLLRFAPDARFVSSRPLALGHGNFGAEPDRGPWSARIRFSGGKPGAPAVTLSDFAGVGPDGRTYTRTASGRPPVSARVTERGIELEAPVGDSGYEGGLYCGYATVPVPTTGAGVAPRVVVRGAPGIEHVPTCLVEGTRLRAFGFYIHDMPAPDLTFALLPALPDEASLIEKPFMLLPVNPFHTKLFFKVTGRDGFADFPNVPPGNFLIRLFSDYGSPIVQTLTDSRTGEPVRIRSDIGENPSYESFEALVLSAAGWSEETLRDRFGDDNVSRDDPTGTFWVRAGGREIRVALGFLKSKPGAAVSSRYVDLLSYEDLDFESVLGPLDPERIQRLIPAPRLGRAWAFSSAPGDPERVLAAFNPAAIPGGQVLGIGRYPFNLTTPNYKAHMSLNFSYEVHNALVAAVVVIGGDTAFGMVTPEVSAGTPGSLALPGPSSGRANFEFHMLSRGVREGTLYLVFVPSRAVQGAIAPLASASVDDLSFELDTWQRVPWPAKFHEGHGMGHAFGFDPNYSPRQMSAPGCRPISSRGVGAEVCEEWQVLVHSPGDDAATVDIHGAHGHLGHELRTEGLFADPRRGVADFSSTLAFVLAEPGVPAELALRLPNEFRTNGRFWEQLVLGREIFARHPGRMTVMIVDNTRGRSSALAPHVRGGAPVAPYVPFVSGASASSVDALALPIP